MLFALFQHSVCNYTRFPERENRQSELEAHARFEMTPGAGDVGSGNVPFLKCALFVQVHCSAVVDAIAA